MVGYIKKHWIYTNDVQLNPKVYVLFVINPKGLCVACD